MSGGLATNQLLSPLTFRVLLCILFIIWLVKKLNAFRAALKRHRQFRGFEESRVAEPVNGSPRSFFSNIQHKIELLTCKGDILDGLFVTEYREHGSTHALLDRFGKPAVIHTIDPVNLNAILNTSWTDWRHSRNRMNTLKPLAQEGLLLTEVNLPTRPDKQS
jgi:hypothetical protein